MATKIDYFRKKLEEEKEKLEKELSSIAKRNPDSPSNWQPNPPQMNVMVSDDTELADVSEELDTQIGISTHLAEKLNQVSAALKRIDEGTYGKCLVGGEPIEEERLEASPTAVTCIKHASDYQSKI